MEYLLELNCYISNGNIKKYIAYRYGGEKMSRLTDERLIDRVELYDTYEKGKQYYESGKVREVKTTPNHNIMLPV